jgi:stage II sporulation protein D
MLKSARFEVTRTGNGFQFRGSGFGHGLGLCQEGSHVMARRGMSAQQILAQYLPGANLRGTESAPRTAQSSATPLLSFQVPFGAFQWLAVFCQTMDNGQWAMNDGQSPRATIASEHFRLHYPSNLAQQNVEAVLRTLETAHTDLAKRLAAASINLTQSQLTQVILHNATTDFVTATGQPAWVAAVARGNTIHLQPLTTLRKRGVVNTTLRHEFVHAALERLSNKRAPRWLSEGLAIHFAGEGRFYAAVKETVTKDELDKRLANPATPQETRVLYAAAYREVQALIRSIGEAKAWSNATKP